MTYSIKNSYRRKNIKNYKKFYLMQINFIKIMYSKLIVKLEFPK